MIGEETEMHLHEAVVSEHESCVSNHGYFKNHHEAYGVIKEEMEEVLDASELFAGRAMQNLDSLWLKIKEDDMDNEVGEHIMPIYDTANELARECIQVMAVCKKWIRLINKEREEVE